MKKQTKEYLINFFKEDIKKLIFINKQRSQSLAEIKNLPNLIIIGAPKCGTTSLFNYLGQHNDIYLSKIKEPHFLVNKKIGTKD